jgi:hypothetical protein
MKNKNIIIPVVIILTIVAIILTAIIVTKILNKREDIIDEIQPSQEATEQVPDEIENTNNIDDNEAELVVVIDKDTGEEVEVYPENIAGVDEYPELDYEMPPVDVQYRTDADLNDDGHIDYDEWESWTEAHPEDTNQDLIITDEEQAIYNGEEYTAEEEIDSDYEIDSEEIEQWFSQQEHAENQKDFSQIEYSLN